MGPSPCQEYQKTRKSSEVWIEDVSALVGLCTQGGGGGGGFGGSLFKLNFTIVIYTLALVHTAHTSLKSVVFSSCA